MEVFFHLFKTSKFVLRFTKQLQLFPCYLTLSNLDCTQYRSSSKCSKFVELFFTRVKMWQRNAYLADSLLFKSSSIETGFPAGCLLYFQHFQKKLELYYKTHLAKTGARKGGIISRPLVGSSEFQRCSSHIGHQGTMWVRARTNSRLVTIGSFHLEKFQSHLSCMGQWMTMQDHSCKPMGDHWLLVFTRMALHGNSVTHTGWMPLELSKLDIRNP